MLINMKNKSGLNRIIDLTGKRGLVIGIANEHSIAYGCAQKFRDANAELAITFLNTKADRYVRPLAIKLQSPLIMPCDVLKEKDMVALFKAIEKNRSERCGFFWVLLTEAIDTGVQASHSEITLASRRSHRSLS